jgi:hypothetical protein
VVIVVMTVAVIVIVVVMVMPAHEIGIARLPPQDSAPSDGEDDEGDAAQEHIRMKRLVEHVLQHRRLPEPQTQADHAESPGEADHAKLIGEVTVAFVMMMIVRMTRLMRMRVRMRLFVNVRMCVFGHRYTSLGCKGGGNFTYYVTSN